MFNLRSTILFKSLYRQNFRQKYTDWCSNSWIVRVVYSTAHILAIFCEGSLKIQVFNFLCLRLLAILPLIHQNIGNQTMCTHLSSKTIIGMSIGSMVQQKSHFHPDSYKNYTYFFIFLWKFKVRNYIPYYLIVVKQRDRLWVHIQENKRY